MAEYTTYYDTSGAGTQASMCTVGLVGSVQNWLKFERSWRKMLHDFGIPYVHMKELTPNKSPHFSKFKNDPERKAALFKQMIRIVTRDTLRVFVRGLDVEAYWDVNKRFHFHDVMESPLALTAGGCAWRVEGWMTATHKNYALVHVHEKGDNDFGTMNSFLEPHNVHMVPKCKKLPNGSWFEPFQAADFVAWEFRRVLDDWKKKKSVAQLRRSWKEVLRRLHLQGDESFLDKDALETFCQTTTSMRLLPRRAAPKASSVPSSA